MHLRKYIEAIYYGSVRGYFQTMDSARIKAYVAAVDEGSFTAAGRLLGYTPSGISQLVSALEDDLGFPLLIRKSRGVVMTREGELIYPEAIDYLSKEKSIYRIAAELSGVDVGQVVIASYSSIATHILPAIIKEFTEHYPSINIVMQEGIKTDIEEMISSNSADIAFSTRLQNPTYSWIPFMEDRMVIVLPKSHRYADADHYPVEELCNEAFIMPGEGGDMDTRDLLERFGIEPNIRFTTVENHTAINMVEEGLGIAVMNEYITKSWDADVAIIPLEPSSTITMGISLPSLEGAPPAVRKFIMFATDRLTKMQND